MNSVPPEVVVIGYAEEPPDIETVTRHMKEHPRAMIILTRERLVAIARHEYEIHVSQESESDENALQRVRLKRHPGKPPESPEIQEAIANVLVGLRHQKGNVVVWIEPGEASLNP